MAVIAEQAAVAVTPSLWTSEVDPSMSVKKKA